MADKRAFATFDVGYLDNPKIADVFDASPIAVCMHFASVLYCAQHLTDGFIALRTIQRKAGGTDEDTRLLIDAGVWHEIGHGCEWCPEVPPGKLYVHDYTQHNRTSEGVKDRSTVARDNANARWKKKRKEQEEADANRIASGNAKQDDSQCLDRQTDRQKKNTSSSPAAPSKEFDQFWAVYPKKVSKQAAIRAWKKATKHAEPEAIVQGAKRYAETERKKGTEREFLKGPDGWLNAGRWEDEAWEVAAGEIDPDAILGRDLWQLPAPPEDLPAHEYKAWAVRVRREHDEARYAEAQKRVSA